MKLQEILTLAGHKKKRKRVGRGKGSGHGKTSTHGQKGAGARAGVKANFGYEGGSNPQLFRIPKRGFNNANFTLVYQVVNVGGLESFEDGQRVDIEALVKAHLARAGGGPIKILGDGNLTKKLTVVAHAFSAPAQAKIAAVGGSVEQIKLP